MSGRIKAGKPKDGPAAYRQTVIDELGMANLGFVDLAKVRTKDDAERVIALWRRRQLGPERCMTATGEKQHFARNGHHALCGFKIDREVETLTLAIFPEFYEYAEVCHLCDTIFNKEISS